jgi:hypothetical protein
MNHRLIFVFLVLFKVNSFAGGLNMPAGSKQQALGNAFVASSDVWSASHNQAGLASLKKVEAGVYVNQGYFITQLTQATAVAAYPTKYGTVAVSFNHFGFKLYNENKTGIAYAKSFGEGLRFGAQANVMSIALGENYGKKTIATFEFGIQAQLMAWSACI